MIPSSEISFQDFDSVRTNFQRVIKATVETETALTEANGTASRVLLDSRGPNDGVREDRAAGVSHYF